MTDKIIGAARRYNSILAGFIHEHNAQHAKEDGLHIHDLKTKDLQALQRAGYGVQVIPVLKAGGLRDLQNADPYAANQSEVDQILSGKGTDFTYIPIDGNITGNNDLLDLVGDEAAQRGICVVRRRTDAHEFEVHRYGNEAVIPRLFDCITLITKGYDPKSQAIDKSTARLVYMPVDKNRVYVFDPSTGHYFPHVIALTEVFLPDRTGDEALEAAEIMVNRASKVYVRRNILLASIRALHGTKASVVGETKTTEILQTLQAKVDAQIGGELADLLR